MLHYKAYLDDLNCKERKPKVTFVRHGQLPCYFSLTLEAAVCTEQMKQGLKQGISLEMSPALSLNTDWLSWVAYLLSFFIVARVKEIIWTHTFTGPCLWVCSTMVWWQQPLNSWLGLYSKPCLFSQEFIRSRSCFIFFPFLRLIPPVRWFNASL